MSGDEAHLASFVPSKEDELGEAWSTGAPHRSYPDHVPLKATATDDAWLLEKRVYPTVEKTARKMLRLFQRARSGSNRRPPDSKSVAIPAVWIFRYSRSTEMFSRDSRMISGTVSFRQCLMRRRGSG